MACQDCGCKALLKRIENLEHAVVYLRDTFSQCIKDVREDVGIELHKMKERDDRREKIIQDAITDHKAGMRIRMGEQE